MRIEYYFVKSIVVALDSILFAVLCLISRPTVLYGVRVRQSKLLDIVMRRFDLDGLTLCRTGRIFIHSAPKHEKKFVVGHELGHKTLHAFNFTYDWYCNVSKLNREQREREANDFAREWMKCVSSCSGADDLVEVEKGDR